MYEYHLLTIHLEGMGVVMFKMTLNMHAYTEPGSDSATLKYPFGADTRLVDVY